MRTIPSSYAAWSGIAGAACFGAMWTMAVALDGSWTFGLDTMSELGRLGGGGRDVFNAAVILAALLWVPFALGLISVLGPSAMARAGGVLFLLSSFSLLCIGLFPIDSGTPHTVASWAFFIMALSSLLIMVLPVARCARLGSSVAAVTLAAPVISITFLALTSVPLAEPIAVICIMTWAVAVSAAILLTR